MMSSSDAYVGEVKKKNNGGYDNGVALVKYKYLSSRCFTLESGEYDIILSSLLSRVKYVSRTVHVSENSTFESVPSHSFTSASWIYIYLNIVRKISF